MNQAMRIGVVALGLAACSSDPDPYAHQEHAFGPITIPAHSEDTTKCVSISLHNAEPLYINQVELTTGPGFHHSNWLFVPEFSFPGPDGVWTCADRSYD